MRKFSLVMLVAVALVGCSMFHHGGGSNSPTPAPAAPAVVEQVQPYSDFPEFRSWKIKGEEYKWAWHPDKRAHAREVRLTGCNGTLIGLTSCAESPDLNQVGDRMYWINHLDDAMARATETIKANRAWKMVTIIAMSNDCGFPNMDVNDYRNRVLPWLRSLGTDGIVVYPVVEAGNRWTATQMALFEDFTLTDWPGLRLWNGSGGSPMNARAGFLNHVHPPTRTWRAAEVSLYSNDSYLNDEIAASGSADSAETGYRQYYYRHLGMTHFLSKPSVVQEIHGAWWAEGNPVCLWEADFNWRNDDWAGARVIGGFTR
jgi:hypothetical protein